MNRNSLMKECEKWMKKNTKKQSIRLNIQHLTSSNDWIEANKESKESNEMIVTRFTFNKMHSLHQSDQSSYSQSVKCNCIAIQHDIKNALHDRDTPSNHRTHKVEQQSSANGSSEWRRMVQKAKKKNCRILLFMMINKMIYFSVYRSFNWIFHLIPLADGSRLVRLAFIFKSFHSISKIVACITFLHIIRRCQTLDVGHLLHIIFIIFIFILYIFDINLCFLFEIVRIVFPLMITIWSI